MCTGSGTDGAGSRVAGDGHPISPAHKRHGLGIGGVAYSRSAYALAGRVRFGLEERRSCSSRCRGSWLWL